MVHSNNDSRPYLYAFRQNSIKKDIYDLTDGPDTTELEYIRISKPLKEYYYQRGVKLILESHSQNERILFTGLLPLVQRWFYGDIRNNYKGTRHIITLNIFKEGKEVNLLVYPFDLDNNKKRRNFLINELRKGHRR